MDIIKELENEINEMKDWPKFGAGDTLVVTYKIKEGDKERLQSFQGVVLQRRGEGVNEKLDVGLGSVQTCVPAEIFDTHPIESVRVNEIS